MSSSVVNLLQTNGVGVASLPMPAPDVAATYNLGAANKTSARAPAVVLVRHLGAHCVLQSISHVAGLTGALADASVARIVVAAGHYALDAELSVTRAVIIEAAVAGTVVLDAQATSSSQRRVLNINAGSSSGVVQLIGLNITGGYISYVSVFLLIELSWNFLPTPPTEETS